MKRRHCVVLVPGFFGFESFGALRYFVSVKDVLEQAFAERGLDVVVVEVATYPTSSIRHRAARVLESIAELSKDEAGPMHIIGHSTGGLDARLAITPTASLPTNVEFDAYHRVHSLVTVATPHYGTPTADLFASFMGKPLLRVAALALAYTIRFGKLPLSVALLLGKLLTRADDIVGLRSTVLDAIFDQLLGKLSPERRKVLVDFLTEVAADQSLVFQLTPEGIDLFNATTLEPEDIHYGSVVTRGPSPGMRSAFRHGGDVYAHSMYGVYVTLYRLAARMPHNRVAAVSGDQGNALVKYLNELPKISDNDGVVPTLSQVWGEVIHATEADHFDVVGHFSDRLTQVPHVDWLPSGSSFNRNSFETLWRAVADFLLKKQDPPVAS